MLRDTRREAKIAREIKRASDNFLPLRELRKCGIPLTAKQHRAAVRLLRMIESGEMAWYDPELMRRFAPRPGRYINMARWWWPIGGCASVGCIGGWIEELSGEPLSAEKESSRTTRLGALLYPNVDGYRVTAAWPQITAPQIAKALRYFLATGDGEGAWPHALAVA